MENQRKIPKRIFSFIFAILCTFGILFVSYIDSFADNVSLTFDFDNQNLSLGAYFEIYDYTDGVVLYSNSSPSNSISFTIPVNDHIYRVCSYVKLIYNKVEHTNYTFTYRLFVNGSTLILGSSSTSSNPAVITSLNITRFYRYSGNSSADDSVLYRYFIFDSSLVPTPSPEPTSTPEPTPTPNPYGPGPVPTIPPGDQSYTDFFTRLASDAQNAFNAIFLSWQNANNKFYSGLFFIGFPVLLGIIGLVASIFFGDDD